MDGAEKTEALPSTFSQLYHSTIGKKQLVATTGLLLCGFLIVHLIGNFLIIFNPVGFNLYAHQLTSTPLIYLAEAVLTLIFIIHFTIAIKLTLLNKAARGVSYYKKTKTGKGTDLFSASMPITGILLLIFLISHLIHFKYGSYYTTEVEGKIIRDLYKTVIEYFASPWATFWYLASMVTLWFHLYHGIQSSFQTFGLNHPRWTPLLSKLGKGLGSIIPLGFLFISIWCYFLTINQ